MGRQDADREAAKAEARERRRAYYESLSPEEQKAYRERVRRARKIKKLRKMAIQAAAILLLIIVAVIGVLNQKGCGKGNSDKDKETQQVDKTPGEGASQGTLEAPDWVIENFVRKHKDSRPGTTLDQVEGIVMHTTGAPGKSAEAIRSDFDLLDKGETGTAASHFVIGIDGTVIQCIPLSEISLAAGAQGTSYISIECCHIDDSGKCSKATYESLLRLVEWLLDSYDLEAASVKRHYDVAGDACPAYYVENGAAWNQFMVDIGGEPVVPEETSAPEEPLESVEETPEETTGDSSEE